MTRAELDSLFAKIEDGLTDAELKRVANLVRETKDTGLQHRGLHILGWAHARDYAPLIASFLGRTDDLGLPAMAIRALVRWFRDAGPYVGALKRFLHGIPQDQGHDLQLTALQVAGDAYRQTEDAGLLRAIVGFMSSDKPVFREAAQDALAAALEPDWDRLSPRQRQDIRRGSNSAAHLERARERLADA